MTDKLQTSKSVGRAQDNRMMAPGDEAPPGTPGTAEDVCPACGGSGNIGGRECEPCLAGAA